METRLLTYRELSAALHVSPAAAKRLANRRRWPKTLGSDGRTRVEVPVGHLAKGIALASPNEPMNSVGKQTPSLSPALASTATGEDEADRLRRQLRGLEAKLILVELERETDRQIATEAAETIKSLTEMNEELSEALKRALDTRELPQPGDHDTQTERLIQERDHWHRMATDRLEKLRRAIQSRPTRIKSFLRWLRAASPF